MMVGHGKDVQIKSALRQMAALHGVPKSEIKNHELFWYMKEKRMGVRWIGIDCILSIRKNLPPEYREEITD